MESVRQNCSYAVIYIRKDSTEEKYHVRPLDNMRIQISKTTTKPKKLITIINVYAPQSGRLRVSTEELDELYSQLNTLVNEHQNKDTALLLICGDFNAKVGKNDDSTECMGKYSRGRRNVSGQCLIDFCNTHNFFITNSAFKHKAAHITTWESTREVNNKIQRIYNQIDYIICPADQKCNLRNARSYNGTLTYSDHRLVATRLDVAMYKIYQQKNKKKDVNSSRIDGSKLINDLVVREKYQELLTRELVTCNKESWKEVAEVITKTAESTIGFIKRDKHNGKSDPEIERLSNKQK